VIKAPSGGLEVGDAVRVRANGFLVESAIVSKTPGREFVDEQRSGPFKTWRHVHGVAAHAEGTLITDELEVETPFWMPASIVRKELDQLFAWRHGVMRRDFDLPYMPPQRIGITGASGLVGTTLSHVLRALGHTVVPFSRKTREGAVTWDPLAGTVNTTAQLDALVHLAGEPISQRWTADAKRRIVESRVRGTQTIANAAGALGYRTLIQGSAIGFYGARAGDVEESSPAGTDFLGETSVAWEEAAEPARAAGARVAVLRTGIVQAIRGGALAAMLPAFRAGGGGPIGGGEQQVSWIGLQDLVASIVWSLGTPISGPLNGTAPHPVSQRQFAKTLGKVLKRPAVLPAPAAAIRAAMGEMGDALVLGGVRAYPKALQASGFRFHWPELEDCLRLELGRV